MKILAEFAKRIAALEARMNNVLQEAIVTAVRADENLLDVEIRGVILEKVPYLTWRAGTDGKTYWVPEVGESGMLLCPDGYAGNAIFLPALNTTRNPAPDTDPKVMYRIWEPGRFEKYDGNTDEHLLSIGGDPTRTTNPDKIEDVIGDSVRKAEDNRIKDAVGDNSSRTIQASEIVDNVSGTTLTLTVTDATLAKNLAKVKVSASGVNVELSSAVKIALRSTGITLTAPDVNVIAPLFKWNGTPTTPIAWVAVS